jgi:acyl-CoA synthetase (AMP-forming)/AMP-acid ligase II
MNIVDLILFQCRQQPPVAALCAPGSKLNLVSYSRLEHFIHNVSRQARSLGLQHGNIVAVFVEDHIFHVALILGLGRLGIATVSVRITDLPKEIHVDAVVSDAPRPFQHAKRTIIADMSWLMGDGKPLDVERELQNDEEDIGRIVLTSGTTGDSKAVALSNNMVLERTFLYTWVFGSSVSDSARVLVDPGLVTAFGYFLLIYLLSKGGTVFFRGPNAIETMQALDLYKVQCIVAAPAALAEFVDLYDKAPTYRSKLDVILTGGSPLGKALAERIRTRLCSNLIYGYGSAEACTVASAPVHATGHIPGAVGYIAPGFTVEAVDEADRVLPVGQSGRLRMHSRFNVNGYLGDPPESENAFRNGFFYPGDLGSVTAERVLVITGREKSVLNLGGDKLNPERIEAVLQTFPDVAHAAAFGVPNALGIEELWAAVVWRARADEPGLRAHCQRQLPVGFVPVRFLAVDTIPRNEMGKIDRRRLLEIVRPA